MRTLRPKSVTALMCVYIATLTTASHSSAGVYNVLFSDWKKVADSCMPYYNINSLENMKLQMPRLFIAYTSITKDTLSQNTFNSLASLDPQSILDTIEKRARLKSQGRVTDSLLAINRLLFSSSIKQNKDYYKAKILLNAGIYLYDVGASASSKAAGNVPILSSILDGLLKYGARYTISNVILSESNVKEFDSSASYMLLPAACNMREKATSTNQIDFLNSYILSYFGGPNRAIAIDSETVCKELEREHWFKSIFYDCTEFKEWKVTAGIGFAIFSKNVDLKTQLHRQLLNELYNAYRSQLAATPKNTDHGDDPIANTENVLIIDGNDEPNKHYTQIIGMLGMCRSEFDDAIRKRSSAIAAINTVISDNDSELFIPDAVKNNPFSGLAISYNPRQTFNGCEDTISDSSADSTAAKITKISKLLSIDQILVYGYSSIENPSPECSKKFSSKDGNSTNLVISEKRAKFMIEKLRRLNVTANGYGRGIDTSLTNQNNIKMQRRVEFRLIQKESNLNFMSCHEALNIKGITPNKPVSY